MAVAPGLVMMMFVAALIAFTLGSAQLALILAGAELLAAAVLAAALSP